ncbi:hypothetical protein CspHIS471_0310410 [Cutaneotrichosporon sp. HIS471]|nr:hypothetical protein CspHIS471_0310410 [Cutaneotrichosporon sp. HIS471]
MRHPEYPFWSSVCLVLLLIPAPWHWRARNAPLVCLIGWLWLTHFVTLVNTLVWADNFVDSAPIWSDISARVLMLLLYTVPLCSLAQMRRLASVASPKRNLVLDQPRKRYRYVEELFLCVVCPLIMLPVNYTVQGHRYDIAETWGPMIPSVSTWPTLAIRFILPTLIACASLFYAALSIRWFFVRRAQFRSILSGSGLTTGVYLRLLGLAVTDSILLMFATVFNILFLLVGHPGELQPTASWDHIHSNFGLVSQFPEEFFNGATTLDVPFYLSVLYAMSVFAFFSFGEDAVGQYLKAWRFVKRVVNVRHRE